MAGNNRVFSGCLGIATCNGSPLSDIISVEYSLNRSINSVYKPQDANPVAIYGGNPDIEIRYTSYMTNGFSSLSSEIGVNEAVGFKLLVGSDDPNSWPDIRNTNVPLTHKAIGGSLMLLTSINYNLNIDGPFTVSKNYSGYSKPTVDAEGVVPFKSATSIAEYIFLRHKFNGSLPSEIALNALQSISITQTLNRQLVGEFATRKPYASYIVFPVETSCTFELLCQDMDTYAISAMDTACKNPKTYKQDINLSFCEGNSLTIPKAYLTGLQYGGGAAGSNDNLTMSVTYTSFETPLGLEPVYIMPEEDPCEQ